MPAIRVGEMEKEFEKIDLNRDAKIIIIGAGISGIAAADYLTRAGFTDFKILEASNRTGGRIYTVNVDNKGHKAELGANWIHGIERNPIYKIADDNNLLELRHGNKGLRHRNVFTTEEGDEPSEKVVDQVNLIYGRLIMQAEDFYQSSMPTLEENDSVGAFLEREYADYLERYTNGDRHIRELLFNQRKLLECCISGCDSLEDVALSEFGGYEELPGIHYTIPPGFEAVLEILKSKIPKDNILLNCPVKCIHWNKNSPNDEYEVKVECENGDVHYANHVIVTVSLGVLKAACDRMFSPSLPKEKLEAIERMGFGIVDKVIIEFEQPVTESDLFRVELLWDNEGIDKNDLRNTWYRKIYSFEVVHENVLVGWLSGKEALYMESLSEEQVGQDIVEVLKKFLKKKDIPQPKSVIRTRWGNNPYTRGSYSFVKVGACMGDILTLGEPLKGAGSQKPQVQFAGEATHECYYSTTHGALLSGLREAQRLVKLYS